MKTDLQEILFNALNEQGYLFQEACAQVLQDNEKATEWRVTASEYPVSLQGEDTRVDIVLRAVAPVHPELYALVECKRADPEYVCWLFGAPGLPYGNALCTTLGIECREAWSDRPLQITRLLPQIHFKLPTYQVKSWLEAKTRAGKRVSTPQNIENAFVQVLRGLEGFATEQVDQRQKSQNTFETFFIPIVITTASLYVASYEPKDIDLSTGKVSKGKVLFGTKSQPLEEEWVLVDYGVGENVAPKPIPHNYVGVDPAELQKYKIRSIFIVNSRSIIPFFSRLRLAGKS
jgi:hypothetical protein